MTPQAEVGAADAAVGSAVSLGVGVWREEDEAVNVEFIDPSDAAEAPEGTPEDAPEEDAAPPKGAGEPLDVEPEAVTEVAQNSVQCPCDLVQKNSSLPN